ncbi:DUF2777 family protein [Halalkalibacter kiskunsagensis]|uniref:DUF2777 family protein n=1 Tax=Halalkalibacter kiskunsagensis TaxID=1548599 RepID=A0ABV6KBA3_9BACI
MDRKQAQSLINKVVKVKEGIYGSYFAVLKKIIAEPRKPWRGIVQILSVDKLPVFDDKKTQLLPIKYHDGQLVECEGVKLSEVSEIYTPSSFEMSLLEAVQDRYKELTVNIQTIQNKQAVLRQFLSERGLNMQFNTQTKNERSAITYTFHHDGDQFILIDENENRLNLDDCPFSISWENQHEWITGKYEGNGNFVSENGIRYVPKEGAVFVIEDEQFDPYVILRNELEPAALSSLEKSLERYKITHNDLVKCHNSLLLQLLGSNEKKSFHGVNFLTYKGPDGIVLVQHHYERTLQNYNNDKIYDRFEFTTDQGKRSISTYTNAYSL